MKLRKLFLVAVMVGLVGSVASAGSWTEMDCEDDGFLGDGVHATWPLLLAQEPVLKAGWERMKQYSGSDKGMCKIFRSPRVKGRYFILGARFQQYERKDGRTQLQGMMFRYEKDLNVIQYVRRKVKIKQQVVTTTPSYDVFGCACGDPFARQIQVVREVDAEGYIEVPTYSRMLYGMQLCFTAATCDRMAIEFLKSTNEDGRAFVSLKKVGLAVIDGKMNLAQPTSQSSASSAATPVRPTPPRTPGSALDSLLPSGPSQTDQPSMPDDDETSSLLPSK